MSSFLYSFKAEDDEEGTSYFYYTVPSPLCSCVAYAYDVGIG